MKLQAIAILTFLIFENNNKIYKFNRYGSIEIDAGMG